MNCGILNHWIEVLKLLSKYFDYRWLYRNNIVIDLNELNRYVEKLSYVSHHLNSIANYVFIKSVDPIPSKHVDIDILVFDDLKHVVRALISKGFRIKKIDSHSITLIHTEIGIELDVHNAIRVPFFNIIPLQRIEIENFYGFKIPDLYLLVAIYLADIVDKKVLYGSHVLNVAYILSLIKGMSFEGVVNRYHGKLLSLPKRLNLRERILVLDRSMKIFRGTRSRIYLMSLENLVKDILYLLKP